LVAGVAITVLVVDLEEVPNGVRDLQPVQNVVYSLDDLGTTEKTVQEESDENRLEFDPAGEGFFVLIVADDVLWNG
jgi:hypothetical protein